jgi:hypothetical protein
MVEKQDMIETLRQRIRLLLQDRLGSCNKFSIQALNISSISH